MPAPVNTGIRGICSMAMRGLLGELAAAYARDGGNVSEKGNGGVAVSVVAMAGVEAARQVSAGEPFDFVVLASGALAQLVREGCIDAALVRPVVRSEAGLAIRTGASRPDVSTVAALRCALLAAPGIGYSTGPSGTALLALLKQWDIADAVQGRLVQAPPGVAVGTLVASGEVSIGFQQLSELIGIDGIAVLHPLAPEARVSTVFSAAPLPGSTHQAAVLAFLEFAASPAQAPLMRCHGMALVG